MGHTFSWGGSWIIVPQLAVSKLAPRDDKGETGAFLCYGYCMNEHQVPTLRSASEVIEGIAEAVPSRFLGVGAAAAVGWRIFGHRLVNFFATLGARFCTLLTLLVQLGLGTQQLDEGLLCSITLLETSAHNTQIATGAISVT